MLFGQTWSPYLVGAGIGILSWISFLVSKKSLGTSTAYARSFGILSRWFCPSCFKKEKSYKEKAPARIDWQWMGFIGIILGTGLFALSYGKLKPILAKGKLKAATIPEFLGINRWLVIVSTAAVLLVGLVLLEMGGY